MAIEDIDHARAAAVQGDSGFPVTVAELAEAAGVELVTGEDEDAGETAPATPRRRTRTITTTTAKPSEDETA